MRALVVYESMFGNTRRVAEAIADGLSKGMDVTLVEVGAAPREITADVGLLVVGGPTHAFSLSRPDTREEAAKQAGHGAVSEGFGLREWLGALTAPPGLPAAAFDTKADRPWLPGSAAAAGAKRLRRLGMRLVARPASFYVEDTEGPLVDGELERARAWGASLTPRVREVSTL